VAGGANSRRGLCYRQLKSRREHGRAVADLHAGNLRSTGE
jgi:hypothetical protein